MQLVSLLLRRHLLFFLLTTVIQQYHYFIRMTTAAAYQSTSSNAVLRRVHSSFQTMLLLKRPIRTPFLHYSNRNVRTTTILYSTTASPSSDKERRQYVLKQRLSTHAKALLSTDTNTTQQFVNPRSFYVKDKKDGKLKLPMPKSLSPSSASLFKKCPQAYLFSYLFKIKEPANEHLAKGSMCHSALEEIYNIWPKQERTLQVLQNLLRKVWSEKRFTDDYAHLFTLPEDKRDVDAERKWGQEGLQLLENYIQLEDPRLVETPNPLSRETWVNAKLPTLSSDEKKTFLVRGIVDRLDLVATQPSPRPEVTFDDDNGAIRIIDYKTGKAPEFKYSPQMNEKIANDVFWQLKIYAVLLREMINKNSKVTSNLPKNAPIRYLRLLYLTQKSDSKQGQYLDMDLGATEELRNKELDTVQTELATIWKNITTLVETQDPKQFPHCSWSYCSCHSARKQFLPGTVCNNDK